MVAPSDSGVGWRQTEANGPAWEAINCRASGRSIFPATRVSTVCIH